MFCKSCGMMTLHEERGRACDAWGGCSRAYEGVPCMHRKVYACYRCWEREHPPSECTRCGKGTAHGRTLCTVCEYEEEDRREGK